MPIYQFVTNMQDNECLQMSEPWKQDGISTYPCEDGNWNQQFDISGGKVVRDRWGNSIVASRNDDFQKTWAHQGPNSGFDYIRKVPEGDRDSYHKDPNNFVFTAYDGKTGEDALNSGPFHWQYNEPAFDFKGISKPNVKSAELIDNGETLRLFGGKKEGDDRQLFLNKELWVKCKDRGITFKDCTASKLKDCGDSRNHKDIKTCPVEYCSKKDPAWQNYSKSGGSEWRWGDMFMNFLKDECTDIIMDDANRAKFNSIGDEMCSYSANQNGGNERCNCFGEFKSETYDKIKKANPGIVFTNICQNDKCINSSKAYRTPSMKNTSCPSQNVCVQGINTGNIEGGNSLKNVNFVCNQDSGSGVVAANTPTETIEKAFATPKEDTITMKDSSIDANPIDYTLYIGGGIAIFVVFMIILVLMLKK